ncbi:MAG TPA: hypothetical protein VL595_28525 [Pseudonocardia sp.]|nr:hypothetical protein [Pseudonocardia sp.]
MSAASNPGVALEPDPNPVLEAAEMAAAMPGPHLWHARAVDRGVEIRVPAAGRAPAGGAAVRGALITTGRALFTMRLALANAGFRPVTTLAPYPNRPAVVAILRYGAAGAPTPDERALYAALIGRGRYPRRLVTGSGLLPLLRRAAETEGAWLRAADTREEREAMAARLSEDLVRGVKDLRYLPILLGTHHDEQSARLQAGEALERVVLTASALEMDALVRAVPVTLTSAPGATAPLLERGLTPQALLLVGRR